MSILLILCVLAAAGWLVLSVTGRSVGSDPGDSVAEYSRAMAALAPDDPPVRRSPSARRRTQRAAPVNRSRTTAHRTAGRPSTATRRRAVGR